MPNKLFKLDSCPACKSPDFTYFKDCRDFTCSNEVFTIQNCNICGLKFTNPRPDEEKLGDYYESENYISHTNSNQGLFNRVYQAVRNYTLNKKLGLINRLSPVGNILDYGCGTGEFLNTCKAAGWKVQGIEPGQKARINAISNYKIPVRDKFDGEEFRTTKFNIITLWHVLEHVPDLHRLIEDFKKVLGKNGKLVIAVPNPESYDASFYGEYWAAYDVPRHLYHFSPKSIKELFEKNGMRVEQMLPMYFDSFYVSMLSEKYLARDKKKYNGNLLRAFYIGLWSNLKSIFNQGTCSSQIYVISSKD